MGVERDYVPHAGMTRRGPTCRWAGIMAYGVLLGTLVVHESAFASEDPSSPVMHGHEFVPGLRPATMLSQLSILPSGADETRSQKKDSIFLAQGQIPSWDSARGMPTDYVAPDIPSSDDESVERNSIRLRLATDFPLRTSQGGFKGFGFQGGPAVSPTLQADLRFNPHSYWYGNITFYRYLMGDRQRPWNPDFTYGFGYDDWHPKTFSFGYGNYGGNRIFPERGRLVEGQREERTRFSQGVWSFGYKFALPDYLEPIFLVDETHQMGCITAFNFTRRYTDLETLSIKSAKRTLSLGCRYSTPGNLFANFTAFYYPDSSQQQPWDPDFTYGFGYFDYRPGTISIQYNNYSGNRFPWNDLSANQGRFKNGSISISWSRAW